MEVENGFYLSPLTYNASITESAIDVNVSEIMDGNPSEERPFVLYANRFYAYFTPAIIIVGIAGNVLSLKVLLSKKLRNMSASRYLIALALADISALIFYVLSDWLKRGLKYLNPENQVRFFDTEGVCQIWLYFNYVSRFVSAWLVVCFTIERYIGVCMPFRRRLLGSLKETMRIITAVIICAFVLLSYKPIMSEVRTILGRSACTSKKDFIFESFVIDTLYGLSITLIPFVIITVLNCLIIHRLVIRTRRLKHIVQTEESNIRLEFTFILLVISFFFIVFNLPYFVTWCWHFFHNESASNYSSKPTTSYTYSLGILDITRTIFYINYCINFFLYTITGGYFRKELKALFRLGKLGTSYESFAMLKVATNPTQQTKTNV